MKRKFSMGKLLEYIFLIIIFVISVFPFYWMIVGTTNKAIDVVKGKMTFGTEFSNNLSTLFSSYNIVRILQNSFKIAVITVFFSIIVSSMAAYGFQFYYSKLREGIYKTFILTMMIPFIALMVPLFKIMIKFNILNSHFAIIITSIASVFLIFFFRQNFKTFPKDIIEAARVDGANEFKIFWSIVIPSMKATYAAAVIYSFMTVWNAYLWPLIVLQTNEKQTITLLISNLASAYYPQYGAIMVAIVIATLPMILVFFTLQKYFVRGITGSVKQ